MNKNRKLIEFWTKYRVPFVYDDTLSLYQSVLKVVKHLNLMIEDQNELKKAIKEFLLAFDEDLQETIEEILVQWQGDGKLEGIINQALFESKLDKKEFEKHLSNFNFLNEKVKNLWVNVTEFGAVEDGRDNTKAIQSAISHAEKNGYGVIINGKHKINSVSAKNVTIIGNAVIETDLKDLSAVFNVENCNIYGLSFNFKSKSNATAVKINGGVNTLKNLSFSNFKGVNKEGSTAVIRVNQPSMNKMNGLKFENIKQVGDGVATNLSGAGRCIWVEDFSGGNDKYINDIRNTHFKSCFNINDDGCEIVEDFDCISIQAKNSHTNISGVTAIDIGKRLIKTQGDNVNVENVFVDSKATATAIFGIQSSNVNISNFNVRSNSPTLIEFLNVSSGTITNGRFNGSTDLKGELSSAVVVVNSKNIKVDGVDIDKSSKLLTVYGENTDGVTLKNINGNFYHGFVFVKNRTVSSADKNGNIDNIKLLNIRGTVWGDKTPLIFEIANTKTNVFIDDLYLDSRISYPYGNVWCANVIGTINLNLNNKTKTSPNIRFDDSVLKTNFTLVNNGLLQIRGNSVVDVCGDNYDLSVHGDSCKINVLDNKVNEIKSTANGRLEQVQRVVYKVVD